MAFVRFGKPGQEVLERSLWAQCALPVSYHGGLETAPGFTLMRTLEPLGSGAQVFERAVAGLEQWAVYPGWMTLYPYPAPLAEGTCVELLTGFGPVWMVSAVRVVAVERAALQLHARHAPAARADGARALQRLSGRNRHRLVRDHGGLEAAASTR